MKINWRERLKNKAFIITMATLVIAFIYQVLAVCGVVPKITQDTITELISMIVNLLGMLGVLIDPTTPGVSDSDRAMTYGTDEDVRLSE